MKESRFNVEIELDKNSNVIYNTYSRKYYIYAKEKDENIKELLKHINKGSYTKDEIEVIKKLLSAKIIVEDEIDELKVLECQENEARYQSDTFSMMVVVTEACNFRCTYCVQEHNPISFSTQAEEKVLKLVENAARRFKRIKVSWFGGEPLLKYDAIERMSEQIIDITKKAYCQYDAHMTTNGFLLTPQICEELKRINIRSLQITLDGDENTHNSRRYTVDKKETFDVVLKNVIVAVEAGLDVRLRINIDENSVDKATKVLELIPKNLRSKIIVSVANFYQTEEKISAYETYKYAIELGYKYGLRKNVYVACNVCQKNGVIIGADGNIIICANASADEKQLGYIDEKGNMQINSAGKYYQLKTVTALNNQECRNCVELPFCIGSCKYRRAQDNSACVGKRSDGLSIEDRILLDILYDEKIRSK